MCVCVTRCSSMSASVSLRRPAVHHHDRHAHRRGRGQARTRAAPRGTADRCRGARGAAAVRVSRATSSTRGAVRRAAGTPFGRPVVPTCTASCCRPPGRRCRRPSSAEHRVPSRSKPSMRAADRDASRGAGRRSAAARRHVGEAGVGDERGRLAVVDDVAGLVAGEVPVDGREPQPGRGTRPRPSRRTRPVRAHEREPVAGLDSRAARQRAHRAGSRSRSPRPACDRPLPRSPRAARVSLAPERGEHSLIGRRDLSRSSQVRSRRRCLPVAPPRRPATVVEVRAGCAGIPGPSGVVALSPDARGRRSRRRCPWTSRIARR